MAKVKLTKTELKAQKDALSRYRKFLPMLQLKKSQLQAELSGMRQREDELGAREDVCELLGRYVDASAAELCGDRAVLGRMKELVAYWRELPRWRRLWPSVKIARTVEEFCLAAGVGQNS